MEMMYEAIRAAMFRAMSVSKAVVLTRVRRVSRMLVRLEVRIAFAGMCFVGCKVESQGENGRPLARAKEKVCREAEAL